MGLSMREMVQGVITNQAPATPYAAAGIDVSAARYEDSLPTSMIDPWPCNRELSRAAVERLAGDIAENGILQPVLVRPRPYGRYQIIAGHHRIEAVKLLSERFPEDARWEGVKALILEMDDDAAERAVLSTNVYMIPMWTPEERGAEWMRLSEKAESMRRADPVRYSGVRTNDIVLELAREAGIETSSGSIIREKRAYRASTAKGEPAIPDGLIDGWAEQRAAGAISAAVAKEIAMIGPDAQEEILRGFLGRIGDGKRYLEAALAVGDAGKVSACGRRIYESIAGDLTILRMLVGAGYEADTQALRALLCRVEAEEPGDGR